MIIDDIIEQRIAEQVEHLLASKWAEMQSILIASLNKPEFEKWGRYLSPKQAMVYTGYSSINGFKEMCRAKQIKSIKINPRVHRYDRFELDKINLENQISDYIKNL